MAARTSMMSPIANYPSKYIPTSSARSRRSTGAGSTTSYGSSLSSSPYATSTRPPAHPSGTSRTSLYTDYSHRHGLGTAGTRKAPPSSLRTVTSPRPPPPARGTSLDETPHGRRATESLLSNRSNTRISPVKTNYGSSTTYTTTHSIGSRHDTATPRSRVTCSVSDIRATFENLNSNTNHSTTSLPPNRSKRFGSHTDLSSHSTPPPRTSAALNTPPPRTSALNTPDRGRHEDQLYDTGGSNRHVGKSYYSTNSRTYDYKSRENGIDALPDIRTRTSQSTPRSVTRSPSVDRLGMTTGRVVENGQPAAGPGSGSVTSPTGSIASTRRPSLTYTQRQYSNSSTVSSTTLSPQRNSSSFLFSRRSPTSGPSVISQSATSCANQSGFTYSSCTGQSGYTSHPSPSQSSFFSQSDVTSTSQSELISTNQSNNPFRRNISDLTSRLSSLAGYTIGAVSTSSGVKGTYKMSRTSPETSTITGSMTSRGLVGLRNVGNTCFMNCILQSLSNTRLLLEYCLNDEYKDDINTTTSSMKGGLINGYAKLMKTLWKSGGDPYISPTDFKSQLQKFAPRFTGYNQQDAQEFLIYLLEGLHEDVNRVAEKKKALVIKDDEGEEKISAAEKSLETWKRYISRENSRIVDIFVGQLKSCLTCTVCGYQSNTFDPLWQLSLPIKKRGVSDVSLRDCLDLFTHDEILDGDEQPTCARCKQRRKCTKSFSIQKFPKILVIHLKRFNHESLFRSKLSTHVDFPLNDLDLSQYASDRGGTGALYNLYAVSNHSGTPLSGHYTAYAKHPYTGEWHCFNDQRVSGISSSKVRSSEGYVLFYELSNQSARL